MRPNTGEKKNWTSCPYHRFCSCSLTCPSMASSLQYTSTHMGGREGGREEGGREGGRREGGSGGGGRKGEREGGKE